MVLENKLGIRDAVVYMKGIDASYHYEGYNLYRTEDIGS